MGSNMLWCKSLTDWTKQYDSWMNTPGENSTDLSSIFFDYEITLVSNE
jgi:CBS domain-containing protein